METYTATSIASSTAMISRPVTPISKYLAFAIGAPSEPTDRQRPLLHTGIVGRIHIGDSEGSLAMNLDH